MYRFFVNGHQVLLSTAKTWPEVKSELAADGPMLLTLLEKFPDPEEFNRLSSAWSTIVSNFVAALFTPKALWAEVITEFESNYVTTLLQDNYADFDIEITYSTSEHPGSVHVMPQTTPAISEIPAMTTLNQTVVEPIFEVPHTAEITYHSPHGVTDMKLQSPTLLGMINLIRDRLPDIPDCDLPPMGPAAIGDFFARTEQYRIVVRPDLTAIHTTPRYQDAVVSALFYDTQALLPCKLNNVPERFPLRKLPEVLRQQTETTPVYHNLLRSAFSVEFAQAIGTTGHWECALLAVSIHTVEEAEPVPC